MNLVLFEPGELDVPLPSADPRAQHILKVLRRAPGETFVAGLVNGSLGVATLNHIDDATGALVIGFSPTREPAPLPRISLILGLPRPQTARDILRDATTLGVSRIQFVTTERTDRNYASATLWTSGEWRRHLLTGASQACDTRLPAVSWTGSLGEVIATLPSQASAARLALDNYEATDALGAIIPGAKTRSPNGDLVLALGPERGWGPRDRDELRAAGFTLCSLGDRVLRLETAVVVALGLARHHA